MHNIVVKGANHRKPLRDDHDALIKHIHLSHISAYCDEDNRGVLIPTSLWESTKDFENQIFEAMDIQELKLSMRR